MIVTWKSDVGDFPQVEGEKYKKKPNEYKYCIMSCHPAENTAKQLLIFNDESTHTEEK